MTQIALSPLLAAGTALMRAGRWTTAIDLLQAAIPSTATDRLAIAAALAEVTVDQDYSTALFTNTRDAGPDLSDRAQHLAKTAPDPSRSGHATFYAGVIADNLLDLPADAFTAYTTALAQGEHSGDDLLISLALRHLGDHAHTAGDLPLARAHWERSTELRQKVGHLLGALAQQTLLAVLARDEGNPAAAIALATEVNRWSHQADIPFLQAQTADLMT
jgi:tetratricopeptide (TPR) repeat protein